MEEQLIKSYLHKTSQHHQITLFDASKHHGLNHARANFALKKTSISMLSFGIDSTKANEIEIEIRAGGLKRGRHKRMGFDT